MLQFDYPNTSNFLLSRVGEEDAALMAPHLENVPLKHQQYLTWTGRPVEHVYFPENGIASIVSYLPNTGPTEIGIFGRDGMSASWVMLGELHSPYDTFMQVKGDSAWRISSDKLLDAVAKSPTLQAFLLKYVQTQMVQCGHCAVSNAHHRVEARLARWLLMCHDRSDGDNIYITHEFLAMMIAAQRSGVTLTLHELEGRGLIRARRGVVTIVDRAGLKQTAGDAYGKPELEYERLIGPFASHPDVTKTDERLTG